MKCEIVTHKAMILIWGKWAAERIWNAKMVQQMTPTTRAHGSKRHEEEWTKYGTQVEKTNLT